ncbi:MAG: helix-turn-helix transcriptional regulator [Prevotella sp.]
MDLQLSLYVKEMRRQYGLTQEDLAAKAGVGLRFVRELEQGKQTLRMDKINQVLSLFGREVGAVERVAPSGSPEAPSGSPKGERN